MAVSQEQFTDERRPIEQPVVFTFRPEKYVPVAPELLGLWEDTMRRTVGLPVATMMPGESGSWSVTGGPYGWDDCDLVAGESDTELPVSRDVPTVFANRPTHFAPVPSDQVENWDRAMQEMVGISSEAARASRMAATPTYGWCHRPDGDFDYCDAI
ncbi:hypothetical protein DQ237_05755 [Blastococcus sp. TF02-8]|uniref:hypothetical protein n=1 Tax=Blastococcus sp. TF02-8 TaxID=2250574 RepID=UPI000DE859D8|nr:hypothetical protein [Blastococcus sp. TF02-8]RBY97090.1 hypothetical protein DQ237_05755 [Blastococcus sp. TF02-8]